MNNGEKTAEFGDELIKEYDGKNGYEIYHFWSITSIARFRFPLRNFAFFAPRRKCPWGAPLR